MSITDLYMAEGGDRVRLRGGLRDPLPGNGGDPDPDPPSEITHGADIGNEPGKIKVGYTGDMSALEVINLNGGSYEISTDDTVLEYKHFVGPGRLRITGKRVTLRHCVGVFGLAFERCITLVESAYGSDWVEKKANRPNFEHCTFQGGTDADDGVDNVGFGNDMIYGGPFRAYRCEITHTGDGARLWARSHVEECYIHRLIRDHTHQSPAKHCDPLQTTGVSDVVVRKNRLEGRYRRATSGGLFLQAISWPAADWVIEDNLMFGGAYICYFEAVNPYSNMVARRNRFTRGSYRDGMLRWTNHDPNAWAAWEDNCRTLDGTATSDIVALGSGGGGFEDIKPSFPDTTW